MLKPYWKIKHEEKNSGGLYHCSFQKNDNEKDVARISHAHESQNELLQHLQRKAQKVKRLEEACKKQEQVIEKLEELLKKTASGAKGSLKFLRINKLKPKKRRTMKLIKFSEVYSADDEPKPRTIHVIKSCGPWFHCSHFPGKEDGKQRDALTEENKKLRTEIAELRVSSIWKWI